MATPVISFYEGELHTVTITLPSDISLIGKQAKVEVRKNDASPSVLAYGTVANTMTKSGQSLVFNILGSQSLHKQGDYKCQLMIYTNTDDAIKFAEGKLTIKPAIVK